MATTNIKIAYIGGGSRRWAARFINDLAQCADLSGEVFLYDLDFEAAKRNEQFGNWVQSLDGALGRWTYTAVKKRAEALTDADFVILSIEPGSIKAMAYDLDIPKKYGIYRSVGVSVGPAGILRSMRAIPIYRDFANAIREHCPAAWVINYTNPMALCTRTLYKQFPGVKAFGCCHEVLKTQKLFASLLSKYNGIEPPPRREIEVNVQGINHFTWVDEARWKGEDLFPLLDRYIEEPGVIKKFSSAELKDASSFDNHFQVAFELYKIFGVWPAVADRELVDFVPAFLQIKNMEDINRWGVKLTTSEYRLRSYAELQSGMDRQMNKEGKYEFYFSGEEGVDQIKALMGLEDLKTNVNLPNRGQQIDLPEDAVVETNALFTHNNVQPLFSGRLPRPVHSMVIRHIYNQETVLEAAFSSNVDLVFQAFLNDPAMAVQPDVARMIFKEMIDATAEYLKEWDLQNSKVLK